MTFPYLRWPTETGPLTPGGEVFRPIIHVRVIGPTGEAVVQGLVDTGADAVILPTQLAEMIGIEVERSGGPDLAGIVGPRVPIGTGVVGWALDEGEAALRWSSRVGFVSYVNPDDESVILGHAGFLEYFVATFDGRARVLELVPAADFPATP